MNVIRKLQRTKHGNLLQNYTNEEPDTAPLAEDEDERRQLLKAARQEEPTKVRS